MEFVKMDEPTKRNRDAGSKDCCGKGNIEREERDLHDLRV